MTPAQREFLNRFRSPDIDTATRRLAKLYEESFRTFGEYTSPPITVPGSWGLGRRNVRFAPLAPYPRSEADVLTPSGITTYSMNLYDHQIKNAKALRASIERTGGAAIDCSDPGTGKSFTALCVAATYGYPIQVICPLGVGAGWEQKAKLCGVKLSWINYERARRADWMPADKDALVIFDEVHRCKSPSSAQAELLVRVAARHKTLLLSATPFGSPLETRAILHALRIVPWGAWYGRLPEWGCFRVKALNNAWKWNGDPKDIKAIADLIKPSIVKTAWRDVVGYPELLVQPEVTNVRDTAAVNEALAQIAASDKKDITKTLKQRMVIERAKVDPLSDIAVDYNAQGMSVIAFFNFTESLNEWADLTNAAIIDGSVTGADRAKVVTEFQAARAPRNLAVNVRAGGEGIDLHDVSGVPRVAMHNPTWSAQDFRQCIGRTHRIGARSVGLNKVYYVADTLETRVMDTVSRKLTHIESLTDADLNAY